MATISYENIIVTGTNRGIGLQFIVQLLARTKPTAKIIATTRRSASGELEELQRAHPDRLHVLHYDATDYGALPKFIEQVRQIVNDNGVDLLINNAGAAFGGRTPLEEILPAVMAQTFENNAVAPLELTRQLLPLLRASSTSGKRTTIAMISSLGGSIGDNGHGGGYAYRTSKAALNMISKSLSVDLRKDGIIVLPLTPGWVKTDLGGERAPLTAQQSASSMLAVLESITLEQSGVFTNYEGKVLLW